LDEQAIKHTVFKEKKEYRICMCPDYPKPLKKGKLGVASRLGILCSLAWSV